MTFENITACRHCGAEGNGMYWQTTERGPVLTERDGTPHECIEQEDFDDADAAESPALA